MSRWIDAEWLMNFFVDIPNNFTLTIGNLRATVNEAPSIDICFCRECKHNYNKVLNHGKMKPRCDFTDRVLTENDFCSRGEREGE